MEKSKITLGLIVGNRGFFPGHLAELGRAEMVKVLQESGVDVVVLDVKLSNYGAIETYEEAMRCAELFRANSDCIDGVVVTLAIVALELLHTLVSTTSRFPDATLDVIVTARLATPDACAETCWTNCQMCCGRCTQQPGKSGSVASSGRCRCTISTRSQRGC